MVQIRDYSYQELCIFARSFAETPGVLPERAGWENIAIEYHPLGPPAECERYLLRHNIRIPLNSVLLEQRIDTGSHLHHALQPGDLLLTPANSQEWLRQQEQEEFLLLYLEPDLLAQIAGRSAIARFSERFRRERVMRDPLLFQIALALRAEMQRANSHFSTIYTQELANAFAAHLLRRYGDWEPESTSPMEHLFTMKIKQVKST
jgi:AraC family transcriptional regulator